MPKYVVKIVPYFHVSSFDGLGSPSLLILSLIVLKKLLIVLFGKLISSLGLNEQRSEKASETIFYNCVTFGLIDSLSIRTRKTTMNLLINFWLAANIDVTVGVIKYY